MGEQARQTRILSLYKQLMVAHEGQLGSGGPGKDPPGFWEGALQNKELATAHAKFVSDIEVSNSGWISIFINSRGLPLSM